MYRKQLSRQLIYLVFKVSEWTLMKSLTWTSVSPQIYTVKPVTDQYSVIYRQNCVNNKTERKVIVAQQCFCKR